MSVKLDVHLGASYDRWCDLHQVRHYGADLFTLDEQGQATKVGTACEDPDLSPEEILAECVANVWDTVADAREETEDRELTRWADLDPAAQKTLWPMLEATVKGIAAVIPTAPPEGQ